MKKAEKAKNNSSIIYNLNMNVDILENLFALYNIQILNFGFSEIDTDGWIAFNIEITTVSGVNITENLKLVLVLYGSDNHIIYTMENIIFCDKFNGYEVKKFSISQDNVAFEISKSRLSVERW